MHNQSLLEGAGNILSADSTLTASLYSRLLLPVESSPVYIIIHKTNSGRCSQNVLLILSEVDDDEISILRGTTRLN